MNHFSISIDLESGLLQIGEFDDLSTENEKKLGKIVKEKFGTDFYIMYRYPMEVSILVFRDISS